MQYRVVCPHDRISGGPEALHQLTRALSDGNRDARIVYMPVSAESRCPARFEHYGALQSHELLDRDDHVIVLPETMTGMVWRFRRSHCVIWWLSVDNYFKTLPATGFRRFKAHWKATLGHGRHYQFESHSRLTHAYQSEYARRFLVERGVPDSIELSDYIAPALLSDETKLAVALRRDQCLYNPLKGREFTDQLIARCTDLALEFVPLQGLSEAQMQERLSSAKLYIDFGEHPGRDRIPREAALGGCVVVTGCLGSAGNDIDMPLPARYKLNQERPDALDRVHTLLRDVKADHATHLAAQRPFREGIRGQRRVFEGEAVALAVKMEREED